jgi:membrane-associated phospholipid phosphatase
MNISVAAPHLFARFIGFSAGRRALDPQSLPAYSLCLLAALVISGAIGSGSFDYDRLLFISIVRDSGTVLLIAFATRWIGFRRMADVTEQVMLLYLSAILFAFCSVILASTAMPMADSLLHDTDLALFGIDRARLIADLALSQNALRFWGWIYNSLSVTPIAAMGILILTDRARLAWALLTTLMATALVSITFVAILPAYGTPPFPYDFVDVFDGVRDGRLRTLNGSVVTGLITFPSMHAADAIILTYVFGQMGRWGVPFVVLNVLMFVSALLVGGHYIIDLLAGGWIGAIILLVALRVHLQLPYTAYPQN